MANKKIQATAQLFLNTKDAQKDAQKFVETLKQKLSDIESAADKMTIFKDMVDYIAQVDRAMANLKKHNKDVFSHMFDGIDTNLKAQLESLFGASGEQLGQIDILRERLKTLTPKSSIKEVRDFAEEINKIFASLGVSTPFNNITEQFSGKTNIGHIELLTNALSNFATVWQDVNLKVSKGFGIGGAGGGFISPKIQSEIDNLERQVGQYEHLIDKYNQVSKMKEKYDNFDGVELDFEVSEKSINGLIDKYNELQDVLTTAKSDSIEYADALAERAKLAMQLIELDNQLEASTPAKKKLQQFIWDEAIEEVPIEDFAYEIDDRIKVFQKAISDFRNEIIEIKKTAASSDGGFIVDESAIENANKKLQEFLQLRDKIVELDASFSLGSDVDIGKYMERLDAAKNELEELGKQGLLTADQLKEIDSAFNDAQLYLNAAVRGYTGYGNGYGDASSYDLRAAEEAAEAAQKRAEAAEMRAEEAEHDSLSYQSSTYRLLEENAELKIENEKLLDQLNQKIESEDELEVLRQENGVLAEKLELLQNIAEQYANTVTPKNREKYEELNQKDMDSGLTAKQEERFWELGEAIDLADEQLEEFGATYDKIILKLSNGKKIEILPDDSGLRKFDKIANEYYDGEYNGHEIEDVIFVRKKENAVIDEGTQNLQEQKTELQNVENETKDVTSSFKELVNYISKSGSTPSFFFDKLESGAQKVDEELRNILQSLNLIDTQGNINFQSIKTGFTNQGGFVSDEYTMIARDAKYLPKIESLQPMLQSAKEAGAQIGAIFGVIEDKAKGLIYEIQNTVAGQAVYSFHDDAINKDILNATDGQIRDLVNTLQILQQKGIFVDWGGDNVLYDKQKGFSIIDLGNQGDKGYTVSASNTIQDNLDRLVKNIFELDPGMQQQVQSLFVDRLYKIAAEMVPSESIAQKNVVANAQVAAKQSSETAKNITKETISHEKNAEAIQEENAALKAQIDLKKKAQSMTWDAFALDESSNSLKRAAGIQTLSDMEKFWKSANYEKQINWHEVSQEDAWQTIKANVPRRIRDDWFYAYDFSAKSQMENIALANDEVRNASLNLLHQFYKQYTGKSIDFNDFLNTEFTVYRGDQSPLIYGDQEKLSFSFIEERARDFLDDALTDYGKTKHTGIAKIYPKDTIGNIGSEIENEVETWVDSAKTSWFKKSDQTFGDFYSSLSGEMQAEIDAGLINAEKNRVKGILGKDITDKILAIEDITSPYFGDLDGVLKDLSEPQKKLASYFAHLNSISKSLPEQFNVVTGSPDASKDVVGRDAKLFNAVLNDPYGLNQHISNLTGEAKFNLLSDDVEKEASAHKQNAQAIQEETKAQQQLNVAKTVSKDYVDHQITKMWLSDNLDLSDYAGELSAFMSDLSSTPKELIDSGLYKDELSGDIHNIEEIYSLINTIENQYDENLDYLKTYLKQVYEKYHIDTAAQVDDNVIGITEESNDNSVKSAEQELKTEQEITEEKQKQAALEDASVENQDKQISKLDTDVVTSAPDGVEDKGYALEKTLQSTNDILNNILSATKEDDGNNLAEPLKDAVTELNKVASGIAEHQKTQKTDTSDAMAKIADSTKHKQISDIAINSVGDLGSDVQIKGMKALADGVVKVEGAFKNAQDEWEGFTVHINESNKAVDLATNKHSSFAKALNETAEKVEEASQETKLAQKSPAEDAFTKSLYNQKNAFNEYRDSLQNVDYLNDELRADLDRLGSSLQQVGDQSGLQAFKDDLELVKQKIAAVKAAFDKINFSHINSAENNLVNTFNGLTLDQQQSVEKEYKDAIATLEQYRVEVQNGKDIELGAINEVVFALRQKLEAYKQANQEAKRVATSTGVNASFGSTASINATAKYNSLTRVATSDQFANSSEVTNALALYEQSYKRMIEMRDEIRAKDIIDDSDKEAFKTATTECNNYAKALDKIIQNSLKLKGNKANQDDYMLGADFNYSDVESRKAALADFAKQMYGVDVAATDFKDNWNKVVFAVKNGDGTFTQMTATFTDARNEIVAMAGDTKKVQSSLSSFIEGFQGRVKSLAQYFLATISIYDVWRIIKQGIQYVRDIDLALTELKKVTDATDREYSQFLQTMSKTAGVVGSTTSELTKSAADWSRLGYSMKEAGELAKSTAILMNVSEFDDVNTATEALISSLQAFNYTADDSIKIVDKLNIVGNNFAISSDGIAEGLKRSASTLVAAGNSLEQSIAMLAAGNKVSQDPEALGNALKVLSMRIRGTKTELEEAGEETDGLITNTSKLQAKVKALTNVDGNGGVDILTDTGAYRSTYDILLDIAEIWDDINNVNPKNQAALLEILAGKTRGSQLAAILQNPEDLRDAYEMALNSDGSAAQELETYLDSIHGKMQQFTNAVQTLWMNLISSKTIKSFVDWGTRIINSLDTIPGKISAIIKALALLMAFKKINPFESIANIINLIDKNGIGTTFKNLVGTLFGVTTAMKAVTAETVANTIATQTNDAAKTKQIMTELGLAGATGTLDQAQKQAIATKILDMMTTGKLTMAQGNAMLAMLGYSGAVMTADGSLKILDATTKSFMATNPIGWILAIVSVIMTVVGWISSWSSRTEKLEEDLNNLNSEISSMKSEIESLNSELETTQDRMAELLAMDSLSFTEAEELENLKLQNAELERQLELQQALLKNKEAEQKEKAKEVIASKWDGKHADKAYGVNARGVIQKDTWSISGVSGKEALEEGILRYANSKSYLDSSRIKYQQALDLYNNGYTLNEETFAMIKNSPGDMTGEVNNFANKYIDTQNGFENFLNDLGASIKKQESNLIKKESGINLVLGDMSKIITDNGLSYSMGDEDINKFLDEYYAYSLKFANAQGTASKSSVISAIWDNTESEGMKQLKSELDEVAKSGEDRAKKQVNAQKLIGDALKDETGQYERLQTFMEAVGVSAEEMANYFVAASEAPDIKTIEGILQVFADGEEILNKYKDARDAVLGQDENGENITWNNLFTDGEDGKTADPLKIAAILEGADEGVREQFTKLVEAVENGKMSVDEAFARWEMVGIDKVVENLNTEFEDINNELFAGVADEIDGVIDTIKELQSALESVAGTMDTLHKAQTQMDKSGRISVKTALELMTATDEWDKILNITEDSITLKDGAEQELIQTQLDAIKVQTQRSAELAKEKYMAALTAAEERNLSNEEKNVAGVQNAANGATHERVVQMAGLETQTDNTSTAELGYADNNQVVQTAESVKAKAIGLVASAIIGLDAAINALVNEKNWGKKLGAARDAWNSAYGEARDAVIADANSLTTTVDAVRKDYERKQGIADVFANVDDYSGFKNYYDYDETPGDKYKDDGSDSDNELDWLDHYFTKIENKIKEKEADLENVISADIGSINEKNTIIDGIIGLYDSKIPLLENAINAYENRASELLSRLPEDIQNKIKNGSMDLKKNEYDDETLEMIQDYFDYISNASDLKVELSGVKVTIADFSLQKFDNAATAFDNEIEEKFQSDQDLLEAEIGYLEEQGKRVNPILYEELIGIQQKEQAALENKKKTLENILATEVAAGRVPVESKQWYEMTSAINDVDEALLQGKKDIESFNNSITDINWDNTLTDFDNQIEESLQSDEDLLQAKIDLLKEQGEIVSPNMYKALIAMENTELGLLNDKKKALEDVLNAEIAAGRVRVDSDKWYEMNGAIDDVSAAIIEATTNIEGFQNEIQNLHWENFDRLIEELDHIGSEIDFVYGLISDDDKVVDEFGNWTNEGITALALMAQEMERAKKSAEEYENEIATLNNTWQESGYSQTEYEEKLRELKEKQWESIEAYEAARKSIIDLNKVRIDAVKNAIDKEIEALEEKNEKLKEELDLEKEQYDFQKQVAEKEKSISDIQRRLNALAGDTSASAIAERRKLEAELAQAQQEMDDMWYEHGIEEQQKSLDKGLENYKDNKEAEKEALDETLKDEDKLVQDAFDLINTKIGVISSTLTAFENEHGVKLSSIIVDPWNNGVSAMEAYRQKLAEMTDDTSDDRIDSFDEVATTPIAPAPEPAPEPPPTQPKPAQKPNPAPEPTTKPTTTQKPTQTTIPKQDNTPKAAPSYGSTVTVKKSATNFSRNGGNGTKMQSWVPGSSFTVYQSDSDEVLIGRNGGYTGWVKLSDIEGYYKGTTGVKDDQWAFTDELGPELTLHAGPNGQLQYLTKGSSVVTADLTKRLMEWGELDPTNVLEQSRVSVGAPHITTNNFDIDLSFGSLVHVDHCDQNTLQDLQKMVRGEFDSMMKTLNQKLKRK